MLQKITYLCPKLHVSQRDGLNVAKVPLFVYNGTAENETMYQINNHHLLKFSAGVDMWFLSQEIHI